MTDAGWQMANAGWGMTNAATKRATHVPRGARKWVAPSPHAGQSSLAAMAAVAILTIRARPKSSVRDVERVWESRRGSNPGFFR